METPLNAYPRVFEKPDGTIVTVLGHRHTVLDKPNGDRITFLPDGLRIFETSAGTVEVPRDIPRHERPFNVASMSGEEVGRLMSNFAPTPFELDGRRFSCVEAFYMFLKFYNDPVKQKAVRLMEGVKAKRFGGGGEGKAGYDGKVFDIGSPEHLALIKRALHAKVDQNPEVGEAFADTYPRPIIHDTGHPDKPGVLFPATVFVRLLTEVRQELVNAKKLL